MPIRFVSAHRLIKLERLDVQAVDRSAVAVEAFLLGAAQQHADEVAFVFGAAFAIVRQRGFVGEGVGGVLKPLFGRLHRTRR